jgi:hypothetical protein
MPARFCQCQGCPACTPQGCGVLYDRETAPGLRCPPCQQHATRRRQARPSSSARGLGWAHSRRKQNDPAYQAATVCHWCGRPFTTADPKTADHLTPRKHGGDDGPIVAAHASCNSSRGGRLAHGG